MKNCFYRLSKLKLLRLHENESKYSAKFVKMDHSTPTSEAPVIKDMESTSDGPNPVGRRFRFRKQLSKTMEQIGSILGTKIRTLGIKFEKKHANHTSEYAGSD